MSPRSVVVVLTAALLISCAGIRSWLYHPPPEPPRPDASLLTRYYWQHDGGTPSFTPRVPGPVLRALSVAVEDLSARQGRPDSTDELLRCASRRETFDAQLIGEEEDRWIVSVLPRLGRCVDGGEELLDGSAVYEISKSDFRILSAERGS